MLFPAVAQGVGGQAGARSPFSRFSTLFYFSCSSPEQMKLAPWNDHTHPEWRKNGSWSPAGTTKDHSPPCLPAKSLGSLSSEHHQFDFRGKVLCSFWPHLTAERSWPPPLSPTPSKFCLDWCCLSHAWAPQRTSITCQQPEVWAHGEG